MPAMIETDALQTTLETLLQPLTQELQQMQNELAAFDLKVQYLYAQVQAAEIHSEQDAVRLALALDQLRGEMANLFTTTERPPLPQLTMQGSARLRHLSSHFRAAARQEQVLAQMRRTDEILAGMQSRARLTATR